MLRTQPHAYKLKTMFASSIREVYVVNIAQVSRLLVCWLELVGADAHKCVSRRCDRSLNHDGKYIVEAEGFDSRLELELTLIQTKAHRKELTESALGSAGAWTCTHLQCRRAGDV